MPRGAASGATITIAHVSKVIAEVETCAECSAATGLLTISAVGVAAGPLVGKV
jgi:hypothetical protein